jgi:hypothetical protein
MTIATQNVGGKRGEFQKKLRPKFERNLDFCVLREVLCDPKNVKKSRLTRNMKPLLYSVSSQPKGGVQ